MVEYLKLSTFDKETQFRLINGFIFAIGINLLTPTLIDIKGEYLTAWVISIFLIGEQLVVRTNTYITTHYSISTVYRTGMVIHVFLILSALLYFINPLYMIIVEGIVYIASVAIFGAYTILLTNRMVDKFPEQINDFQIVRNRVWANGLLCGLCIATTITYFTSNDFAVVAFVVWEIGFLLFMLYNFNFYEDKE